MFGTKQCIISVRHHYHLPIAKKPFAAINVRTWKRWLILAAQNPRR